MTSMEPPCWCTSVGHLEHGGREIVQTPETYFGYPGDRSSLLNIICLFIHFFIHTWLQWVINNRKRTEKREKEQSKLNLDDEVAWLLWMSKAVHILFGFALLLFAPVHSPRALTLIFILHENISLFRTLCPWWRLKKWTRNERGFVSRPLFSIVLTDREPRTSYKNINAILMVTSVKEFRDTTSKNNWRWITLGNNVLIGSVITLDSLLCTFRIGQ